MKGLSRALPILISLGLSLGSVTTRAAEPCEGTVLYGGKQISSELLRCTEGILAAAGSTSEADRLYLALSALNELSVSQPSDDVLAAGRRIVAELDRRHVLRPEDRRKWQTLLMANGRANEAAAYGRMNRSQGTYVVPTLVPKVPVSHRAEAHAWRLDTATGSLVDQAIDLRHGRHVVVASAASCGFCRIAVEAISQDAELREWFADSLWIMRPSDNLDVAKIRRWNVANPATPMLLVTDTSGWPLPNTWMTPTFLVLEDGVVTATVDGWSAASRAALAAALRR